LFATNQQYFSHTKSAPATSNKVSGIFSHNKSAPAASQPNKAYYSNNNHHYVVTDSIPTNSPNHTQKKKNPRKQQKIWCNLGVLE
jgi:hypothetical protein